MTYADLGDANLSYANLSYANLTDAYLYDANLTYADLSEAYHLGITSGSPYYNAETDFTNAWADSGSTLFDPVAAGWTFVPEPSTALLLGIGLAGLRMRRRRRTH